jgi:hypothetical protein
MDKGEIIAEYRLRSRKAARLRAAAFLLLGVILLLWAAYLPLDSGLCTGLQGMAAAGFLIAPLIALLVFSVTINRCPACFGIPKPTGR